MAFAYTVDRYYVQGNKKVREGTFTNGAGDTGGDIDTGLYRCESMILSPRGAAVIASAATVNESLPCAGNAVTIVCTADEDGQWRAIGY